MMVLLHTLIALTLLSSPQPQPKIAVFKGRFDDVESVLRNYRLEFTAFEFKDIEKKEIYENHHVVFFPCGLANPYEESINVLVAGSGIKGVALRDKYFEPDIDLISQNIKKFIEAGGAAYFSDYSIEFLQAAYSPFKFYADFPNMGMPGRLEADVYGDLGYFSLKKKLAVYMDHTGWIVIKPSGGYEILAQTDASTPRGNKPAVITALIKKGRGEIIYTSYHESVHSDFRRFNIYRVIGHQRALELEALADKWGQSPGARITDSIQAGENGRIYYLKMSSGKNTVYFDSGSDPCQINLFDTKMNLLYSVDNFKTRREIDINISDDKYVIVKVLPSSDARYGTYSMLSSSGTRILPYFWKILKWASLVSVLIMAVVLFRIFGGKKYG